MVFFFKQKTAYEIKECDWSSDVCSSDLINQFALYAFTKELGELETNRYFSRILREKNKQKILVGFDALMEKVPKREVSAWDKRR